MNSKHLQAVWKRLKFNPRDEKLLKHIAENYEVVYIRQRIAEELLLSDPDYVFIGRLVVIILHKGQLS